MKVTDYKVTKLDKRHNGYSFYKYSISPAVFERGRAAELIIELRNWCWATYGPSTELGFTKRGDKWAWETDYGKRRIYLQSDAELTFWQLKFN